MTTYCQCNLYGEWSFPIQGPTNVGNWLYLYDVKYIPYFWRIQ